MCRNATLRYIRVTIFSGKAISIKYYKFMFVTLVIQRAMRMRRIILPPVASPHYLINSMIFEKRY